MASLQVCKTQWNRNESARYQWKLGICHHFHEELHWLWDCWQRSLCFFFSFLWYSKQALVLLNRKKYSCVTCLQSGCRKRPENALIWQPSFMIVFIYPVEIMPGIERYFLWRKAPWLVFFPVWIIFQLLLFCLIKTNFPLSKNDEGNWNLRKRWS